MRRLTESERNVLEIGGTSCTHAALFRGRVDTHEDEVGLFDTLIDLCGKKKVPSARFAYDGL